MNHQKYLTTPTIPTDPILQDWRWLIGPTLKLWRITLTGDAFLLDPSDNSIHFLDTISGTIEKVAPNEAGFEAALKTADNADRWLMPHVVKGQAALGMRPGPNQCLSFKIPPALGGQIDPDNIELCEVTVHFSMAGQIHRQVKDLPPGTKISISADGKLITNPRPWWKFW